jgi:hypothetical protein
MTCAHPIFLPEEYVRSWGMNLVNDFHWRHLSVCTAPDGDRYVLSDLYYNHYRYDDMDDRHTSTCVLTRYAPDGTPLRMVVLDSFALGGGAFFPPASLCGLWAGRLLLSSQSHLLLSGHERAQGVFLDAALDSVTPFPTRVPDALADAALSYPAFRNRLTPSGRTLCLLGDNVVAVSDGPIKGVEPPALTAVTALWFQRPHLFDGQLRSFPPEGATGAARPRTELGGLLKTAYPRQRVSWIYDVAAIDDSTYVVLALGRRKRIDQRGANFVFAIVGEDGGLQGHLDLDCYRDGAGRRFRFDVVVDQAHRRIFHLNTFGLYVFDDTGARLLKLSTDIKEHKPLAQFQLREYDPYGGHLVLVHEKENLLLTIPVPNNLDDLSQAVTTALAEFRKRRTWLKQRHLPENWHWTMASAPVTIL